MFSGLCPLRLILNITQERRLPEKQYGRFYVFFTYLNSKTGDNLQNKKLLNPEFPNVVEQKCIPIVCRITLSG